MAETKHNYEDIRSTFAPYPKVKYMKAKGKEGDLISPSYPRIATSENTGLPEKKYDRHPYITKLVANEEAEKALPAGWVDNPEEI
jgi:hypothetical protein